MSDACPEHTLYSSCGSHYHLPVSCRMRWKREAGERRGREEGGEDNTALWEGTHLSGQVQLPAAVFHGPPKCVHCHLLSMRLTACQNEKPTEKDRKSTSEGRALTAEMAGALGWLWSLLPRRHHNLALRCKLKPAAGEEHVTLRDIGSGNAKVSSPLFKDHSEKWHGLYNALSSLPVPASYHISFHSASHLKDPAWKMLLCDFISGIWTAKCPRLVVSDSKRYNLILAILIHHCKKTSL